MKNLVCEYCGKVKNEVSFFIGESLQKDWTMHEGTGKISCPDCYDIASEKSQNKINNYIKNHNARVEANIKIDNYIRDLDKRADTLAQKENSK